MKITCTRENLKKALNLCSKVVGSNSTLPILNNLLFRVEAGQLTISATNLEIAIKTWLGGQIDKQGEITVPAKTITDFVNNTNEEKITLETTGTDLKTKTENTESTIKGLSAEEFPLIPEIKPQTTIGLSSQELSEGLSQVAFATAFSETQPELSGVLFHFEEDKLRLAATDRYRLAEKTLSLEGSVPASYKIIVPNRAIGELVRMLSEDQKKVEISIAENQVLFRVASAELISRVIEGQYPDYQQIIPKDYSSEILVETGDLVAALKLSGLFVADNNNVELEIHKTTNMVVLKSSSQRFGSNTTQVKGEVKGENNKIIFNHRYILDCLNHIGSKQSVLKIIDSASPAMIIPPGQANYLYLAMPIKT